MIQNTLPKLFDILYEDKISSLVTLEEVRDACHSNQIASKNQAIQAYTSVHKDNDSVLYVGAWFGILTNYLLENFKLSVTEIEIDYRCRTISKRLNYGQENYVDHYIVDVNLFDRLDQYDTIINLSSEHMPTDWFDKVKPGTKLVLQNNNLQIEDHVNTCDNIDVMKSKYNLTSIAYESTLELNVFNRYTLAGIK